MLEEWSYRRGLPVQMALSYIWVTAVSLLMLQVLAFVINGFTLAQLTAAAIRTAAVAVLVISPLGGLFGAWATRRTLKRIRTLVSATTRFADGDYSQRVEVVRADEVGQLEGQFNHMAEQLVESIGQQRALAEQNARMQERARISRDLHDAISQNLFSVRTLANGLHAAIQTGTPATELEPHVALLEQTAITMTREMRALLLAMRPPQLEGMGFHEALSALADSYASRLGIAVTAAITPVDIGQSAEEALLRICQEALNNAARHGNATLIHLELAARDGMAALTVTDNGQGFDPAENDQSNGLGLHLMHERVQELNGHFAIDSAAGHGTRIEILVPQEKGNDSSRDCG